MKGRIHSFETLGAVDGPGLRCVVFLQGCPMRCSYCHNPDTWSVYEGIEQDSRDVVKKIVRYKPYFGNKGGVTLCGGEPLVQAEFAYKILKQCKEVGIHTAVDTSGCCMNKKVEKALRYTDLVILDIKHVRPDKFYELTGHDIENTLRFLEKVVEYDIPLWVRQVILPGWNDTKEDIIELASMLKGIPCLQKVELLPYHRMGIEKWNNMGMMYRLEGVIEPKEDLIESLQSVLNKRLKLPL